MPEKIRHCPLPLVVVSQSLLKEKCDLVMNDNRQAAVLMMRKLKEPERQIQRITLSGQLIARESA